MAQSEEFKKPRMIAGHSVTSEWSDGRLTYRVDGNFVLDGKSLRREYPKVAESLLGPRRSANLFGFGGSKSGTVTYSAAGSRAAFAAGSKHGDTAGFSTWFTKQKYPASLRSSLEKEYRRGVEEGGPKASPYPVHVWDHAGYKVWAEDPKKHGGRKTYTTEKDGRKKIFYAATDVDRFIEGAGKKSPAAKRNAECASTVKANVSDRAKRYRANQPACLPSGAKKCALCASTRDVMVDHKDGDESNGAKSNLRWLCRSCNVREGAKMAASGKGRRTAQYNPKSGVGRAKNLTAKGGASNLYEYTMAGENHTRGKHDAGGKIIHNTPKAKRREFASEIWRKRKSGEAARADDMPDWAKNPKGASANPQLHQILKAKDGLWYLYEPAGKDVLKNWRLTPTGTGYKTKEQANKALPWVRDAKRKSQGLPPLSANPSSADAMYREFHGRGPTRTLEIREQVHEHEHLATLGDLAYLKIKNPEAGFSSATIFFNEGAEYNDQNNVFLMCSKDGKQLFIRGGNQEVNLKTLGMDSADWVRDSMVLGKITEVAYHAEKGFDKFELTEYFHKAGEETRVRPILIYDYRSKLLDVSGGQYEIKDVGIVN